jgi:hypothetical protein
MALKQNKLEQLPEYQAFEKILDDCRKALREQGDEFAARMKLYADQYASGQITEDELKHSVRGLEYPLKAWITKQNIFMRRRMYKLVDAALNHLTGVLIEAVKAHFLPFI